MKRTRFLYVFFLAVLLSLQGNVFSQTVPEAGDPPNNVNVPDFYISKLPDIEAELAAVKVGKVEKIATSPGGLPVYAVYYGKKDNLQSQANYNSAIGAGDPVFYAKKTKETQPVVFFLGPVHGQEVEGMAGLINLIHIAETGKDLRGKEWVYLKSNLDRCRVIINPLCQP